MFGGLLMVGISYAMRQHAHMNVDALVNVLPRPWKRAATLVAIALCFAYVALMIWGAVELVARLRDLGSNARDLPVRRWVLTCMLPAGFALLGLRLVQVALEVLRGQRDTLGSAHGHVRDAVPPGTQSPAAQSAAVQSASGKTPA
jgi:C4-dicarboxylate transporter DctQ subunit